MSEFIAFDLETTGTNPKKDAILEIGAALFVDNKLTETFGIFVNPGREIPAEATRVHGITNDMVANGLKLLDALEQFTNFCSNRLLVAHNASFDFRFLSEAMNNERSVSPKGLILDTYKIAKTVRSELFNHRLESLVKHYKITAQDFHRAVDDSIYCGKVFVGLGRDLAAESKAAGKSVSLQKLVELSGGELRFPSVAAQGHQLSMF
jgi:DNA polymerase III epsilon subunit family exonuclease